MIGRRAAAGALGASLLAGCAAGRRSGRAERGPSTPTLVHVGTAAGEVRTFVLDDASGALTPRGRAAVGIPVTALAAAPDGTRLFAASASSPTVVSLSLTAASGTPAVLGRAVARGGTVALAVDRSGNYVVAAGTGGALLVLPIGHDGRLEAGDSQAIGAKIAGVALHPAGGTAFAVDERARSVAQFGFATGTGILTPSRQAPVKLPKGGGPGPLLFHPTGRYAYVVGEEENVVSAFTFEESAGTLSVLAFQTLPTIEEERARPKARAVGAAVSPDGRRLFVLHRGPNAVVRVDVDRDGGLTLREEARLRGRPFGLAMSPGGGTLLVATEAGIEPFTLDGAGGLSARRVVAVPGAVRVVNVSRRGE